MTGRRLLAAGVLLPGLLLASGAVAAGPAMSVNWTDVGPSQDACVKRAADAVRQNKFTTNFEVISNRTIYGERGSMTAAVRCVAEKGVAFIAVAGGDGKETGTLATAIRDAFAPAMNSSPLMNAPPAINEPPATSAPPATTAPPAMDSPPRKGVNPD
jgi:hypothetical protein